MTPAKLVYLMIVATGLALGVVWQGAMTRRMGYSIQDLRAEGEELRAQRAIYRAHLSKLKNARRVSTLVSRLGFNLQEPPVEPELPARTDEEATSMIAADTPASNR
jgi:hypothetical protein